MPAAVATLLVVVVVVVVVCITKPDWKFEQVAAVEMHSLNQQQKAFFEAKWKQTQAHKGETHTLASAFWPSVKINI